MCTRVLKLATLFSIVYVVGCETPSFLTRCKQTDENCYKNNAENMRNLFANGIPEYNVEQMEPIRINKIDASSNNLQLTLKDVSLSGLKDCDIKKLVRNPSKESLLVSLLCNVKVESEYKMSGRISIFPIEGEGKLLAKIRKILISAEVSMPEYVAKDGKRHWKVPSWTHEFETLGDSDVQFGNLFKGNKELNGAVNDFISKNGNVIINEVGGPVVNAIITKLVENLNHFLRKLSIEDISI